MAERDSYGPGTPCWVDLMARDADAARRFYGDLLGWEAEDRLDDQGRRIYVMFCRGGRAVAGLGEMGPEQRGSGMPAAWSTYVCTADIDALAARVPQLGGAVIMEPMQVMTAGRMCVVRDPTGAVISFWQPGDHIGAGLVNEPGAWVWSELETRDTDTAAAFYGELLGWTHRTDQTGPMAYTEFRIGDTSVAGMMAMPDAVPPEVPSYWLAYFAVEDCDRAVEAVQKAGGTLLAPVMDLPVGRFAVVADPEGAVFSVIRMAEAPV